MADGIFLSQLKYVIYLVEVRKPSPTQFQSGVKLIMECTTPLVDGTLYHHLVDNLIYLKHNRTNISFVVSMVSKFMQWTHESHWKESKRILRYLEGTVNYVVFYSSNAIVSLLGYTNFDWVSDSSDRRSTTVYLFQLGSSLISWSSKKVNTLALSSCEAKYIASKEATKEAVWLCHVLTELGLIQKFTIELRCDNQGAIQLAYNLVYHSKTKHLYLNAHYIHDLVVDGTISLTHCPIEQQATNIFTKSMIEINFVHLLSLLGMREVVIKGEH